MFAIAWEYLLNKAFAAEWADRNAPEWPPHPDRAFQALVAAWGENGRGPAERTALEWLERQGPPALAVPPAMTVQSVGAYVPANDDPKGKDLPQLLPGNRHRSKRTFPATTVAAPVTLTWKEAAPPAEALAALRELCARVTHVGSSRSLVRMWVVDDDAIPEPTWLPDARGELSLRVPAPGRLATLEGAYADGGEKWQRPPCAPWRRYREAGAAKLPHSAFAADWTVLKIVGRSEFGLAQSPAVTAALRDTLIKGADDLPGAMRLVSGHESDGAPLTVPHLAAVPLG
ncbi:MAG: type I-U CRISPR-associated protein Cas5/Cas6, partial [Planctomycetes bacterium]|nr:type I-U CRISPR-associated protein Cas5/Cas6 [Planctomycetota bacterium]